MAAPLKIFCSYAKEDDKYRQDLKKFLYPRIRKGVFKFWHDQEISAGENWDKEIEKHLKEADIIIMLVSADFLCSDYCYNKELRKAQERHEDGQARIVFILVSSCDWEDESFISSLQILPKDKTPISLWPNQDHAWTEVVKGLNHSAQDLLSKRDPFRELPGHAIELIEFAHFQPASDEDVQAYYKGEMLLNWEILAAHGDIERDICDELIQIATTDKTQTNMLCLYGERGLGKSTLAWRVAEEVAKGEERKLLRIKDNDNEEIWRQLDIVLREKTMPVVVLIDDVFRDSTAWEGLTSLHRDLPITIIATSRSNELPQSKLPFPCERREVTGPTTGEKERLLQKLSRLKGKEPESIQRERLEKATSWAIAMLEITTEQDQKDIFKKRINRLQNNNKFIHRAYGYLCFAGKYDLGVPETLLARIEPQASDILEHPDIRDLVFANEHNEIRTQHSAIVSEVFELYKQDEQKAMRDFISAIDVNEEDHRWFLLHLCRAYGAEKRSTLVKNLLHNASRKVDSLLDVAGSGELLYGWAQFYYQLEEPNKAKELERKVLSRELKTSLDCHAHLNLLKRQGKANREQTKNTIDKVRAWLSKHDEETDVRAQLLGLAPQLENRELLHCLIEETSEWLSRHDKDVNTRQAYLRLFRSQKGGTKEQEQERNAFDQTETWLKKKEHQDNTTVRQAFLGFVQRRVHDRRVHSVIEDTVLWLEEEAHKKNANVRQTYLELVNSKGTKAQKTEAIEKTRAWVEENSENNSVYQAYLKLIKSGGSDKEAQTTLTKTIKQITQSSKEIHTLVESYRKIAKEGSQQQIEKAIEEISLWVEDLQNVGVRSIYQGVKEQYKDIEQARNVLDEKINKLKNSEEDANSRVKRLKEASKGTREEMNNAIEEAIEYLVQHPHDINTRKVFLGLIEQQGDKERIATIIEEVRAWLKLNPREVDVRARWLGLVGRWGNEKHTHTAIEETAQWLSKHVEEVNVRQAYLKLVGLCGTEAQLQRVFRETNMWLARHQENSTVRHAYLGLVKQRIEDESQVREVIEETRLWLTKYRKNTSVRQTYLGLVRAKGDSDEIRRTIEETEIWLDDYPENANVLQTYLELIAEKGTKEQKQRARDKVKIWLDNHPENTNVLQSYLKIIDH